MEGRDDGVALVGFLQLDPALLGTKGVKRGQRAINFYSRLISLLFYDWHLGSIFLHIVDDNIHLASAFVLFLLLLLRIDQLETILDGVFSPSLQNLHKLAPFLFAVVFNDMCQQCQVFFLSPRPFLDLGVQKTSIVLSALLRVSVYFFSIGIQRVKILRDILPLVSGLGILSISQMEYF